MNRLNFEIRFAVARLRHFWRETLPWKIAWWLPRKVALFAFVRVFSIRGDCPAVYAETRDLWERSGGSGPVGGKEQQ